MAKDDTIENRVYLFESLASSFVAASADLLASEDEADRMRALRALADLAFVSCVVADTGKLPPEQVRQQVREGPPGPAPKQGKGGQGRKRR
jgi:hypothetical protein